MDNTKYNSYIKYKSNTFFNYIKNDISISSGVNQFECIDLYKELINIEFDNQSSITTYAEPKGNQLLIDALSYYENYFFQKEICGGRYKLCMVAGATLGINSIFDYCSMRGMKCGLAIGYSYTLFGLLAERFGFEFYVVISKDERKIIPNVNDIEECIIKNKAEFICLTEPLNPSGEMYQKEEFQELLRVCKKYDCLLIVDKCQRDELQIINDEHYFSINKLIYDENALDYTIIINSLSKTRSIPGLRIGYTIATDAISEYIEYMNTITYWHCNSSCSFAVAIDTLYQLVYLDSENINHYISDYRKMIRGFMSNPYIAKRLLSYLNVNTIIDKANRHCHELMSNYNVIRKNYAIVREYALRRGYKITTLSGGFNFCIFCNSKISEKEFKRYVSEIYKMELFTQEDFCCYGEKSTNFWIRISCAEERETFENKFNILCSALEDTKKV